MRPNDFDITLYDAGVHTLIDSVVTPMVALQDQNALDAIVGYLTVYLAQPGSLATVANEEALQAFVLHAQRVDAIDVDFLDTSFTGPVRAEVPGTPPIAPVDLFLTDAGSGVVNASCSLGSGLVDRYELQHSADDAMWSKVDDGVIGEGTVNFQATGLSAGTHYFRVIPRWGFFAGFPGASDSVEVA